MEHYTSTSAARVWALSPPYETTMPVLTPGNHKESDESVNIAKKK